jgi:hypothetical protein
VTEKNQPDDGIERVEGDFNYLEETRYWLPGASEERCQRIAKKRGLRLVKVVNTKKEPLPIMCVFEEYPDE